jgi:hypothetical protein
LAEDPENEFAVLILETGIEEVLVLERRTEDDICSWLRFEGNDYHDGAGFGIVEHIYEAPKAQKQWIEYAHEQKITVRGCPSKGVMRYDAQKNDYIGNAYAWEQYWISPAHFQNCVELHNLWMEHGIDAELKNHIETINDVLAKSDHTITVKNLLFLSKVILKAESRATWGKKCLLTLLKVQCHFYLDVRKTCQYKDASGRLLKKLFTKACGKEEKGPALLEVLMGPSMLYTPKEEKDKKKRKGKSTGGEEKKARRGGGQAAMELIPEENLSKKIELVDASVLEDGQHDQVERDVGFSDEICLAAEASVGELEEENIDFDVLEMAQVFGSWWAYDEDCILTPGQLPPDGWISARKQIVKFVANKHEAQLRDSQKKKAEEVGNTDVPKKNKVMKLPTVMDQDKAVERTVDEFQELKNDLVHSGALREIAAFVQENLLLGAVKFQPKTSEVLNAAMKDLKPGARIVDVTKALDAALAMALPKKHLRFAHVIHRKVSMMPQLDTDEKKDAKVEELSNGSITDMKELLLLVNWRAEVVMSILRTLGTGMERFMDADLQPALERMQALAQTIAEHDSRICEDAPWEQYWSQLLMVFGQPYPTLKPRMQPAEAMPMEVDQEGSKEEGESSKKKESESTEKKEGESEEKKEGESTEVEEKKEGHGDPGESTETQESGSGATKAADAAAQSPPTESGGSLPPQDGESKKPEANGESGPEGRTEDAETEKNLLPGEIRSLQHDGDTAGGAESGQSPSKKQKTKAPLMMMMTEPTPDEIAEHDRVTALTRVYKCADTNNLLNGRERDRLKEMEAPTSHDAQGKAGDGEGLVISEAELNAADVTGAATGNGPYPVANAVINPDLDAANTDPANAAAAAEVKASFFKKPLNLVNVLRKRAEFLGNTAKPLRVPVNVVLDLIKELEWKLQHDVCVHGRKSIYVPEPPPKKGKKDKDQKDKEKAEKVEGPYSMFGTSIPSETGIPSVFVDEDTSDVYLMRKSNAPPKLVYIGTITVVPVQGSLHLCNAFGLDLYIAPSLAPVDNNYAWKLKAVTQDDIDDMRSGGREEDYAELVPKSTKVKYNFKYMSALGKEESELIEITIHYLEVVH